jgi:hypothetical protein
MIFSDLASPADPAFAAEAAASAEQAAGFAKAGNRYSLFGIMRYFAATTMISTL